MALRTKQSVLCLILSFSLSLEISLASPIYDISEHYDPDLLDSNYDVQDDYVYDSVETNDESTYECPGDILRIVSKGQLCDGFPDCTDGSDEDERICEEYQVLRNKTTTASPLIDITLTSTGEELEAPEPCAFDEFRCSSETSLCIDQRWVCDGIADCSEGEDEHELLCGYDSPERAGKNNLIRNAPQRENLDLPSRHAEELTLDGKGDSRSVRHHHHRNEMTSRIMNHRETKMRKSVHPPRVHPHFSDEGLSHFPVRSNPPFSPLRDMDLDINDPSPVNRKSDSTPMYKTAEFNTVLRQLPVSAERNGVNSRINGETGETVASDFFLNQLTDQEAESLLKAYTSFSANQDEVDVNSFLNNSHQETINSTSLPLPSTESPVRNLLPVRSKQARSPRGHKKKLKNSIGQFVRRFGKLLSSSSSMNDNDINITINIQNSQKMNHIPNFNTQETNQSSENEPVITLKVEMTL